MVALKTEPFSPGDTIAIYSDFVDGNGAPATPTAATLEITEPDADQIVSVPIGGMTVPQLGRLEYAYTIPAAGDYFWRIVATLATGQIVARGTFQALDRETFKQRPAGGLCTITDVKRQLPNYQEPRDALDRAIADKYLADLIGEASELLAETAGREFVSVLDPGDTSDDNGSLWPLPATETRIFDMPSTQTMGSGSAAAFVVGDMQTLDSVTISYTWEGATPSPYTLDLATRVRIHPSPRAPSKPIRRLEILGGVGSGDRYRVTGKWGWPKVPAPISRACATQAAYWANRDIAKYSDTFLQAAASGLTGIEPRSLIREVYDVAFLYRIPSI